MGGKSKKARENEEFDAFLKDLQSSTKAAGEAKKKKDEKIKAERAVAEKARCDARENINGAQRPSGGCSKGCC